MNLKCVGILTGGGDCPGLNAVIGSAVRKLNKQNVRVLGLLDGWKGMLTGDSMELTMENTSEILPLGGTIIGTSRTNPYKDAKKNIPKLKETMKSLQLDALIAVGGDDTLGVANRLWKEEKIPIVGVPKTIDNDISATDFTFGFDSAVNVAMEAIDRLKTTAESHHRVLVVEVMGRHAGWIATYAGLAGGADVILVPEKPVDIDEVCTLLKRHRARSKAHNYNIVVVAEGVQLKEGDFAKLSEKKDEFGNIYLGGISNQLAQLIEQKTGFETRTVILGHLQRGGTPTAFDRVLGIRFGMRAARLVLEGRFGYMVALQGNKIVEVPLEEGVAKLKTVDPNLYETAVEYFRPF
ncbi:MAG: ATP-dependent 6-phosphofructokinase [Planctomycetota bacterium]|nr:ATP-dependent 6-phosphofructokinase [Planctomycetota bacterium]